MPVPDSGVFIYMNWVLSGKETKICRGHYLSTDEKLKIRNFWVEEEAYFTEVSLAIQWFLIGIGVIVFLIHLIYTFFFRANKTESEPTNIYQ